MTTDGQADPTIIGVRLSEEADDIYLVTLRDGEAKADFEVRRRGGLIPTVTVSGALHAATEGNPRVAERARRLAAYLDEILNSAAPAVLASHLTFQDAVLIAHEHLCTSAIPVTAEVVLASCHEYETAWVFAYQTRAALNGDPGAGLAGNGPVVVPKDGSPSWFAATAPSLDEQVGSARV